MKFNGEKVSTNVVEVVFPVGEKAVRIRAKAVTDFDAFDAILPFPKAPMKIVKGGKRVPDAENPVFLQSCNDYGLFKTHWIALESLKATEELTWDTVDMSNPQTWKNYEKELREAFSDTGYQRVMNAVWEANHLNEDKLEEARERFLTGKIPAFGTSGSPQDEAATTPNGEQLKEPASVSPESAAKPGTT